jgi:cytochrome c oxidase cbb3-type subunit 1
VNSFADTVKAMYPMYVVRALGGGLFLLGALIMCYNLWKTVRSVDEKSTARSAVPAE